MSDDNLFISVLFNKNKAAIGIPFEMRFIFFFVDSDIMCRHMQIPLCLVLLNVLFVMHQNSYHHVNFVNSIYFDVTLESVITFPARKLEYQGQELIDS